MKKSYIRFILLLVVLGVFVMLNSINNSLEGISLPNEQTQNGFKENDFIINNISIFNTTYEELIKIMKNPKIITNIEDKNIVGNYGYLSVLSYKGLEITINTGNNFNLTNGLVTEIDIVSSHVSTTRGISINDTKEKVQETYSIKEIYSLKNNNEYPIHTSIIKGFKRNKSEINMNEYDEYCYIQNEEKPIAIIFLFKDNIVRRIVLRHLTAG